MRGLILILAPNTYNDGGGRKFKGACDRNRSHHVEQRFEGKRQGYPPRRFVH